MLELPARHLDLRPETLERHQPVLEGMAKELFESPLCKMLVKMGRSRGYTVEAVPYTDPYVLGVRQNVISINGHLCGVHEITKATRHPAAILPKGKVTLRRHKQEGLFANFFCTNVEWYRSRRFIVPNTALL